MGIKSILGVSLLTLALVSLSEAQQSQFPVQAPRPAVGNQGYPAPVSQYPATPGGYVNPNRPPVPNQWQGAPQTAQPNPGQWPHYPYPQYHNPYYQGVSPRAAISGTIDWVFALPSNLMDRFSSFVDGNFFPQVPATQGALPQFPTQGQQAPQVVPGANQVPPPAKPYSPDRP